MLDMVNYLYFILFFGQMIKIRQPNLITTELDLSRYNGVNLYFECKIENNWLILFE